MKTPWLTALALCVLAVPTVVQAQTDHQGHHPAGSGPPQAQTRPQATPPAATAPTGPQAPGPSTGELQTGWTMGQMPEPSPVAMRQMMAQMMPGGMMQGGMQGHGTQGHGTPAARAGRQSEAAKGYAAAVDKMHAPMMQGIQDPNPDAAFVKGMIPHHQSAIDMARIALQYGQDEQVKKWANDVIREQEREIGEMQAWLKKHGH
jgi:uncharacterized protein (DUF305 family)